MPPVIGITSNFDIDRSPDPPRGTSRLREAYSEAIFAAGGIPHPLPVPRAFDPQRLDALLDSVDGLLFTGGNDLDPRNYGESQVHPESTLLHERRDAFELALFKRADTRRKPTLCICLGMQVAHVARGGRLIQHVDDLPLEPRLVHHMPRDGSAFHRVTLAPDARLAEILGGTDVEVNSRHHQIVDRDHAGRGLRPVAWAPDGVLEASEDGADGRYLVAVQWHPEDIFDRPEQLRLFQSLVVAAAGRRIPALCT